MNSARWLDHTEEFLNTAFEARSIMQSDSSERKRELILAVGQNLFLKDKKIDIQFKKPYDVLLKPYYHKNVLAVMDVIRNYF